MQGYGFESSRRPSNPKPSTLEPVTAREWLGIWKSFLPYVGLVVSIGGFFIYAVHKGWL